MVGLGSNLLAADEGVDALVLRLEGELAAVEVADTSLVAGGGATNAGASIAPERPASAASSSRARFPGPRAAA